MTKPHALDDDRANRIKTYNALLIVHEHPKASVNNDVGSNWDTAN